MSAPAFTPGPWTTRTVAIPPGRCILIESENDAIASLVIEGAEDRANAQLIKSAPTLYAALDHLRTAMACHDSTPEEFRALADAVAALTEATA